MAVKRLRETHDTDDHKTQNTTIAKDTATPTAAAAATAAGTARPSTEATTTATATATITATTTTATPATHTHSHVAPRTSLFARRAFPGAEGCGERS